MMQLLTSTFLVCVAVPVLGVLPGPLFSPTKGEIWPRPFQVVKGNKTLVLDPHKLDFKGEGEKCNLISEAVIRYRAILEKQAKEPLTQHGHYRPRPSQSNSTDDPVITDVVLRMFGRCEIYPYLNMDESYSLSVSTEKNKSSVTIQAHSVWGILRGLESFSQLSYFNGTLHQLVVEEVKVWDKPRFPHRGLMIDTARHYLHKKTIKHMIEAMEYNKFNVLHWHIVDDQSFPYKSTVYPDLSEKGAYSPEQIYTERDIREIIEFARVRGIRVIPEFDTPGHTQSWGLGQPDLLTPCYTGSTPNGLYGPVDPTFPSNYHFLHTLFKEITHLYVDSHVHFGGDEVDFSCWQSNPNISVFMMQQGMGRNYAKLESYYVEKVLQMAANLSVVPIVWQEVFLNDKSLSNDTVIHVWTGNMQQLLSQVTGAGMKAILSTCWYLDHFSQDLYAGGGDWRNFYACEPLDFTGSDEMKQRVLGGEACMWAEVVDDTNIIPRVWPRACSAAERLWSSQFDVNQAANRLEEHVCRMRSRGIGAQPPNGPSTCY